MARLKVKYNEEIAPALMAKFQYKSVMQIPKLDKVVVNVGCGESKNNAKEIEAICKTYQYTCFIHGSYPYPTNLPWK